MKKNIIIIVLIAVSFFLGASLAYIFLQRGENNDSLPQESQLFSLRKSQIDTFKIDLDNYRSVLSRYDIDKELIICNQFVYLYSIFPVVEYNILNRRDNQKIISSIIDTVLVVLPSIGKEYLSDNYRTLLLSLTKNTTSDNIKLCYLYFVENSLMNNYLSYVYQNSISLSHAELLNIASKNVIKLGETYRSQLIFSIKDISGNKDLIEITDDTLAKQVVWDGTTYVERPTSTGKIHHDFLLFFSGFYGNRGWETSVDYEVK